MREHLETGHAGHFDIQEQDVGFRFQDGGHGLHRVGARADYLHPFSCGQHPLQALQRERFVVNQECPHVR